MEDILSVMILVFMPVFSGHGEFNWTVIGTTLLKIAAFGIVMFVLGKKFIPWLLERIAHTRSRELFLLAVLAITLGTALDPRSSLVFLWLWGHRCRGNYQPIAPQPSGGS
jgi:CPA2 family monovalent cation:H+ antiporter-2